LIGFTEESELVGKAQAGDRDAFATLCERYKTRLWRTVASVARGSEVEDLAQEAVVRAWCALHTFRSEASFAAWLCRIALNVAHDYHKSAWKRRVLLFWQDDRGEEPEGESPESMLERREMQRRVRKAVAALPEKLRVPIWLYYFEEFTLAEIARLEEAAESTIRSRVQTGLRRLSRYLEDFQTLTDGEPACPKRQTKGCEI
jgi:RNA polymerase sigma-70 factor (ECF subfamily)